MAWVFHVKGSRTPARIELEWGTAHVVPPDKPATIFGFFALIVPQSLQHAMGILLARGLRPLDSGVGFKIII